MKKYGQADFMIYIAEQFIEKSCSHLTEEQKDKILKECRRRILEKYPSSRETEFAV